MKSKADVISDFKKEVVKKDRDIPVPVRKKLLLRIVMFQLPSFWFFPRNYIK